ncbi:MAG: APC family permease, partial [Clostridiales Family XIII bacterium]|nr:APC family permease [Clostridiales Family XIII bacterium]
LRFAHPEWKSPYHLKGGMFTRFLSLGIAVFIAILCTLGQGAGSWKSFLIYIIIGIAIWLWMMIFKWPKQKVKMMTPDGEKEY